MARIAPARASKLESRVKKLTYAVMALAVALILLSVTFASYYLYSTHQKPAAAEQQVKIVYVSGPAPVNITSNLITPLHYLPSAPPVKENQSLGKRLTNINTELNSTELSVINNASDSYFEKAGEMYLNGTLHNVVGANVHKVPAFIVNGKPSVIYLGSITCVWCGENRWAMALALSRFGQFSTLFKGYSALQDSDVPTLYWAPAEYNQSTVDLGSFYRSGYINFIAIEETDPITQGFNLLSFSVVQGIVNATGNPAYTSALQFILKINNFQGTPYTIWGADQVGGADAVDFGNSAPSNSTLPLTYMTHEQVLAQLSGPESQFAWTEYAAADLYVAMTCSSLNNTAPVCSLPAIRAIEKQNGY